MEKRQEIFDTICKHLSGRGIDLEGITAASDLVDDVGLDSLDTVELTLGLEESFGIEIPDSELENVRSIDDVIDLIQKKLAVGA